LAEQQLATVWHGAMAVFLIAVMIAHIYIGTVGMEGAFEAMGKGHVDLNWAREHHNLWVDELERKGEVRALAK
jgi:formate dehydrogenase subunit gamma